MPGPTVSLKKGPEALLKAQSAPEFSNILSARQRIQRARESAGNAAAAPRRMATAQAAAQYSFVSINIPNSAFVQPNAINNVGLVVGYYADENYNNHGFLWQNGTVQTIDYPGALSTSLTGINDWGVMIGAYQDENYNTYTVTYSLANSAWTVLPNLPGGLQEVFGIAGINDEGLAVGCAGGFLGPQSWIWHPDSQSYSYFTAPAASEATTCGQIINNFGSVVGSMSIVYSNSPFLFLGDYGNRYTNFSLPSSLNSPGLVAPFGINDADTIVGSFFTADYASASGFILTRGGSFTVFNQPGADQTYLTGINDFGVLCGDTYDPSTGQSPGFVAYPRR
jgi:probable HAF family extracellular repeat protein